VDVPVPVPHPDKSPLQPIFMHLQWYFGNLSTIFRGPPLSGQMIAGMQGKSPGYTGNIHSNYQQHNIGWDVPV